MYFRKRQNYTHSSERLYDTAAKNNYSDKPSIAAAVDVRRKLQSTPRSRIPSARSNRANNNICDTTWLRQNSNEFPVSLSANDTPRLPVMNIKARKKLIDAFSKEPNSDSRLQSNRAQECMNRHEETFLVHQNTGIPSAQHPLEKAADITFIRQVTSKTFVISKASSASEDTIKRDPSSSDYRNDTPPTDITFTLPRRSFAFCDPPRESQLRASKSQRSKKGSRPVAARTQSTPMSLKKNAPLAKEPFSFAKISKLLPSNPFQNKKSFALREQDKVQQASKMGNANLKKCSSSKSASSLEEQQYIKRSIQRRRNGQREVHRNTWRAEKRATGIINSSPKQSQSFPRPSLPKRPTYKKGMPNQSTERDSGYESKPSGKQVLSSVSNEESATSSPPSRSETLVSDGQSLLSDQANVSIETFTKCTSCDVTQGRLSKAYAQKGATVVALERTQKDLSFSQKRVKELEANVREIKKEHGQAMITIGTLESEIGFLQKKTVARETNKNPLGGFAQSDASDSSHVSSIYVSGSQKTLDDGFGEEVIPDDDDEYDIEDVRMTSGIRKELDFAREELQRLKDAQIRKEELESTLRHCEDRITELEDELKSLGRRHNSKQETATQTVRRDGTFTRQPSEKTKIPKRLIVYHSSLPVISDPVRLNSSDLPKVRTGSLSHFQTLQKSLKIKEMEITNLKHEMTHLEKELNKHKEEEPIHQDTQIFDLKAENEKLQTELKHLTNSYMKERVTRKKLFNLVEDMKGKIRVYCRIKPHEKPKISTTLELPDEYTVLLKTHRAKYEFLFDQVFHPSNTQEDIFQEVQNLVQSALDGYNVCIFAYGQTGSGKTYTLIGTEDQPGVGPRAFRKMFESIRENQTEMTFRVCVSVFELYNERLIDLLKRENEDELKIRRDRFGLVFVQGSVSREVNNEDELMQLFEEACNNRHTGRTRMNPESSRSHLIATVMIESKNIISGTVLHGKLNIVDLAGSERTGKTAAVAEQLREANSINKSLSALGDVIAALSCEQQYVPYRNNKLTLLMQDSLGSNAKTLMFVTISSSEQNVEESLNSLTYASRVKQISNSATRIAETKEIARLKAIITKMTKEGHQSKV